MRHSDEQYIGLLDAAIDEEIGMFIRTDNLHYLENVLYRLRKAHESEYAELAIFRPVIDGETNILFIAKKTVELPE